MNLLLCLAIIVAVIGAIIYRYRVQLNTVVAPKPMASISSATSWLKTNPREKIWLVTLLSFIMIRVISAMLWPELWEYFWNNPKLFWSVVIIAVYWVAFILRQTDPEKIARRSLATATILVIIWVVPWYSYWEKLDTPRSASASSGPATVENDTMITVYRTPDQSKPLLVAKPGEWTKWIWTVNNPNGWSIVTDDRKAVLIQESSHNPVLHDPTNGKFANLSGDFSIRFKSVNNEDVGVYITKK